MKSLVLAVFVAVNGCFVCRAATPISYTTPGSTVQISSSASSTEPKLALQTGAVPTSKALPYYQSGLNYAASPYAAHGIQYGPSALQYGSHADNFHLAALKASGADYYHNAPSSKFLNQKLSSGQYLSYGNAPGYGYSPYGNAPGYGYSPYGNAPGYGYSPYGNAHGHGYAPYGNAHGHGYAPYGNAPGYGYASGYSPAFLSSTSASYHSGYYPSSPALFGQYSDASTTSSAKGVVVTKAPVVKNPLVKLSAAPAVSSYAPVSPAGFLSPNYAYTAGPSSVKFSAIASPAAASSSSSSSSDASSSKSSEATEASSSTASKSESKLQVSAPGYLSAKTSSKAGAVKLSAGSPLFGQSYSPFANQYAYNQYPANYAQYASFAPHSYHGYSSAYPQYSGYQGAQFGYSAPQGYNQFAHYSGLKTPVPASSLKITAAQVSPAAPVAYPTAALNAAKVSDQHVYASSSQLKPAVIVSQSSELGHDGTFSYNFASDDGIAMAANGGVKALSPTEEAQVVQGSYSYTAPDGTPISANWFADETGFHVEGDHIPKPATQ